MVIARADRDVQAKFLLRNGADEVINPEKQIAEWAAIRYTSDNILDYIRLDDNHAIYLAETSAWDAAAAQLKEKQPNITPQELSEHLGVSVVTVEGAYSQLMDEGYITSRPKSGFFVSRLSRPGSQYYAAHRERKNDHARRSGALYCLRRMHPCM